MDKITVTGFSWAPPFAHGVIRDLRVRWALEEAGLPYEVTTISLEERHSAEYRRKQPFAMVPVFETDAGQLFETGAILYRIAEDSEALMPVDQAGRTETLTWMFAALNTVEPQMQALFAIDQQHASEAWAPLRRPAVEEIVRARLAVLTERLEGRDHLLGRFTVADILMVTVLRFLRHTDLMAQFPVVEAYVKRCEARPPFRKSLGDQLAGYARHEPIAA